MRSRVAGIGLPQILRRADGTGIKVRVTTLSRLGGRFWIFKAFQWKRTCHPLTPCERFGVSQTERIPSSVLVVFLQCKKKILEEKYNTHPFCRCGDMQVLGRCGTPIWLEAAKNISFSLWARSVCAECTRSARRLPLAAVYSLRQCEKLRLRCGRCFWTAKWRHSSSIDTWWKTNTAQTSICETPEWSHGLENIPVASCLVDNREKNTENEWNFNFGGWHFPLWSTGRSLRGLFMPAGRRQTYDSTETDDLRTSVVWGLVLSLAARPGWPE